MTALAVSGGTVYAGGNFTSIGGQTRNYLAAVDSATGLATSWNPNANGDVVRPWLQLRHLYCGGIFASIGNMPRTGFAQFASTSTGPTVTLSATAGANGSISPSGSVAVDYGSSQTFTITPNTNYRVADVLVDGVSVGAVTSYTFSSVTANHTISATFALQHLLHLGHRDDEQRVSPGGGNLKPDRRCNRCNDHQCERHLQLHRPF